MCLPLRSLFVHHRAAAAAGSSADVVADAAAVEVDDQLAHLKQAWIFHAGSICVAALPPKPMGLEQHHHSPHPNYPQ